ncbi:calcium-binding protein [Mangrovicoccus sp. HB161399]|uniref:calcium-binding protein n=1 Tax=Mangrovicoccus sp. HB161399 TaxID=2720392 RepID=UPI0015562B68|nr:calcium-binding protein [Mangrovicoccus sp. HB161399]
MSVVQTYSAIGYTSFSTVYDGLFPQSVTLSYIEGADLPDDTSTAATIAPDSPGYGTVDPGDDWDWYGVSVESGYLYSFFLTGDDGSAAPLEDPYLYLYDSSGSYLAENDDWDGLDSRVSYVADYTGTVYVAAGSFSDYTGGYVLSMADPATPPSDADDFIEGTAGADELYGLGGDDTIYGYQDSDWLDGGDGADEIHGGAGSDTILGGAQWDVIDAGLGSDDVYGGFGSDLVHLGDGDDYYDDTWQDGANGRDTVNGESGSDYIYTGGGNDLIFGGSGFDQIDGGDGDDRVHGGLNRDIVYAGYGDDTVWGGGGRDQVYLDEGNNVFWDGGQMGWLGGDYVEAGSGKDAFHIGGGNDTVIGGGGVDRFIFAEDSEYDEIWDFENGTDLIDVSAWGVTGFEELTVIGDGWGGVEIYRASDMADVIYATDWWNELSASDFDASDFVFAAA